MTDKVSPGKKLGLYRYIRVVVLVFAIFFVFDMLDGKPDGLRGLAEFFRLVTGA